MPLFQLGALTIVTPGPFNATDTTEDFGADYGVKPLVGARQDREFDGPADDHFTISGTLFPHFYERAGKTSPLEPFALLREMTDRGTPQTLMRGDGVALGSWYVERVQQRSARLASDGRGMVVLYDIALVRSTRDPDPVDQNETLALVMNSLVSLYN